MGQTTSKTCLKCGETKLLDQFGKDKSRRDGRNLYCRACVNEKSRASHRSLPDREPCLCGCGEYPRLRRSKYVQGHLGRGGAKRESWPCDCGCGGIVAECRECHRRLHFTEFNKGYGRLGIRPRCKPCDSENAMRWKDANHEKALAARLLRTFGISIEEYRALEVSQNGLCAICGKPPTIIYGRESGRPGKRGRPRFPQLVVDHDHVTGKVRGLLCGHCNRGIGFLKDDPEIVRQALKYLERGWPT